MGGGAPPLFFELGPEILRGVRSMPNLNNCQRTFFFKINFSNFTALLKSDFGPAWRFRRNFCAKWPYGVNFWLFGVFTTDLAGQLAPLGVCERAKILHTGKWVHFLFSQWIHSDLGLKMAIFSILRASLTPYRASYALKLSQLSAGCLWWRLHQFWNSNLENIAVKLSLTALFWSILTPKSGFWSLSSYYDHKSTRMCLKIWQNVLQGICKLLCLMKFLWIWVFRYLGSFSSLSKFGQKLKFDHCPSSGS